MHRQHDHLNIRMFRANPPGRFDPIYAGHLNVHHDDVRMESTHSIYGVLPICRFGSHLDIEFCFEQLPQSLSNKMMIIHYDYSYHIDEPALT